MRERSQKDLKRSWFRSKLNTTPVPPREVVIADEEHFTPDWGPRAVAASSADPPPSGEVTAPAVPIAASPAAGEPASTARRDIWGRLEPERTTPRLRVALDYHHVIHELKKVRSVITFDGIPDNNIDQVRRLAAHHEVWILSFAPSAERAREVFVKLRDSGILDIIGGEHKLLTGQKIPLRASFYIID